MRQATKELNLRIHPNLFSYLPMSHIAELNGNWNDRYLRWRNIIVRRVAGIVPKEFDGHATHNLLCCATNLGEVQRKDSRETSAEETRQVVVDSVVRSIIQKNIKRNWVSQSRIHRKRGCTFVADLIHWFSEAWVNILQAYGMTEDCVYAHFNRPYANRPGTVGKPLSSLKVKLPKTVKSDWRV